MTNLSKDMTVNAALWSVRAIAILLLFIMCISIYVRFNLYKSFNFGFEGFIMGCLVGICVITTSTLRKINK